MWWRETGLDEYDNTLPFVNEWVWFKMRLNGTLFFNFSREQRRISKKWQIKGILIVVQFKLCLLEALKLSHLRDPSLTDRQKTDRQTDRLNDNPLAHVYKELGSTTK